MNRKRSFIWGVPAVLYVLFVVWYTDFGGPLRPAEVETYLAKFAAIGASPESLNRVRIFMEADSGRQFLMLNAIDYADNPPDVPGATPGESSTQLMNRYMEHMFAQLLKRACHPVIMGNAAHTAMDLVGVESLEGAEKWDMGAFFRYRSRRTFMEIVTIPETRSRHEFKVAALNKTIAYPIEVELNLAEPRFLLGLILLSTAAISDLLLGRR